MVGKKANLINFFRSYKCSNFGTLVAEIPMKHFQRYRKVLKLPLMFRISGSCSTYLLLNFVILGKRAAVFWNAFAQRYNFGKVIGSFIAIRKTTTENLLWFLSRKVNQKKTRFTLWGREISGVEELSSFFWYLFVVNLWTDSSIAESMFFGFLACGCFVDVRVGFLTAFFYLHLLLVVEAV